jgi:hypothetical protein
MSNNTLIQVQDVTRHLPQGGRELRILNGLTFAVEAGCWLALTGPSGSGKSTLLGILAGIDRPSSGQVYLAGAEISALSEGQLARLRNQKIGVVFQSFHLIPTSRPGRGGDQASQQELALLIAELRPGSLGGQGLAEALGSYLATWSQHTRIPADLQVQGERRLPLATEQALFRVAQEALSNVARHSRAFSATVTLAFDPSQVTLRVADNGVGFDPAVAGWGFGLQSMRERVAALRGHLELQTRPGGGVVLTACAPALREDS